MIEHLDTPPSDPRILVGESIYDGVEGGWRQLGFSEAGGRNGASETTKGFQLMTPLAELLNQDLFPRHEVEDSRGFALGQRKQSRVKPTNSLPYGLGLLM